MYLEWAKKHLSIILFINILFMIITLLFNGFDFMYIILFFMSTIGFGLLGLIHSKILANEVSPRTSDNVLLLDIFLLVSFILSIFRIYNNTFSFMIWLIVPLRTLLVFFSIKFNIRGREYETN